jgi:hypothetical protein
LQKIKKFFGFAKKRKKLFFCWQKESGSEPPTDLTLETVLQKVTQSLKLDRKIERYKDIDRKRGKNKTKINGLKLDRKTERKKESQKGRKAKSQAKSQVRQKGREIERQKYREIERHRQNKMQKQNRKQRLQKQMIHRQIGQIKKLKKESGQKENNIEGVKRLNYRKIKK